MSQELAVQPQAVSQNLTAAEIKAGVNLIQQVMAAVMKKDVHYGALPGCGDKPTLLKAGAEKLLTTFRIAVDPQITDLSTTDEAHFRVIAKGIHQTSGNFVGSGVGEASSNEEKYKWRFAACDAEWDATQEDRRRLKYKRDGSTIKQIRTNVADVANTVLKMAKKRAQVDLTLTATAASDCFAQDLEDLEPEVREAITEGQPVAKEPIKPPVKKAAPTDANVLTATFTPAAKSSKNGSKNGKDWTSYSIKDGEGNWYSTFDETIGKTILDAAESKQAVSVTYVMSGDFRNIKDAFIPVPAKVEEVPF